MAKTHIDLTNQRFGKLTALYYVGKQKWMCKCDCGVEKIVDAYHLKNGDTKSCGCSKYGNSYTHRMSKTRIFKLWQGIKRRCTNKNDPCYKKYGAKGITICPEWEHDFMAFYTWAMANGYSNDLSIDRIDPTKNYEPSNCRWVDIYTQANNKVNTVRYDIDGVQKTLPEWCREYNMPQYLVAERVRRLHWDIERALITPPKKKAHNPK